MCHFIITSTCTTHIAVAYSYSTFSQIEGNRKQNAIEATLRRHDRIALAERRRRNIIDNLTFGAGCRCCYDANQDGGEYKALIDLRSLEQEQQQQQEFTHNNNEQNTAVEKNGGSKEPQRKRDEDSDSDSDDEFNYLLDDDLPSPSNNEPSAFQSFQQERIEEMQLYMMMNESAVQHGFGAHRQFHPQRVLHAAGLGMGGIRGNRAAAIPPAVVVHLYDPESELSGSLDLCLEKLGETYKGTKYVRANGRATLSLNDALVKEVLPKISRDSGIPALIAVRDGMVVAVCPNLASLGDARIGRVDPGAVEHWLDNARVLLRDVPLEYEDYCRIRPEEDALVENMMREKARLDEIKDMIFNCGVPGCNKTFHHEHVGIKNEEQSGLLVSPDETLGNNGN